MYKKGLIVLLFIFCSRQSFCQNETATPIKRAPRNIIVIMVNGMGMNQIAAAALKKGSNLSFTNFPIAGLVQPWHQNGVQPNDSSTATAIGTNKFQEQSSNAKTLFDIALDQKMKTGLITTRDITAMTPKTLVFNNYAKKDNEALALNYVSSNLDIIVGGGRKYFDKRYDGRNLFKEFKSRGYNFESRLSGLNTTYSKKTIALLDNNGIFRPSARDNFLVKSATFAVRSLGGEGTGFFLVMDDSKIEEADSLNNTPLLIEEMLDFDKLVSALLEQSTRETLILITSNYESGALELKNASITPKSDPEVVWHGKKPSPELAPVFASGPGSDQFSGFYSQADIYKKLVSLLKSRQ